MNTPMIQAARIMDLTLLGPFMVWFGLTARGIPEWARAVMAVSGLMTMYFNGRNYGAVQRGQL